MIDLAMTGDSFTHPIPLDRSLETLRQRLCEALPDLTTPHGVKQLWLFGSRVRGEEGPESDLDVLVEFDETPSLFGVIRLENELTELLGVQVDLVMKVR